MTSRVHQHAGALCAVYPGLAASLQELAVRHCEEAADIGEPVVGVLWLLQEKLAAT
ncbi:MAG: hypothetical protein JW751_13075 [Polyangiaceae bacterium]|nr:hypothetical protein [Polyangiaceae bacterium]